MTVPEGKGDILRAIGESGIVAVIRGKDEKQGMALSNAVYKGGIRAIEVTMTIPGAVETHLDGSRDNTGIHRLSRRRNRGGSQKLGLGIGETPRKRTS
ncbi:beta/alpha barrel domain-containing protein [Dethiosulfovibrio salsuginis]|uniref:KDPG and KHG aldolase n=1 Tax=Dethiosulfovibrio salsuginis TaxID=561720 RepID=A0A1X7IR37_9BACT|nr:hypothetical protein [Dethiosulfovibrio salsuginis]SMG17605.1 KDPG and KHG aldolase [Dethiosulfovibrio salsuginis]